MVLATVLRLMPVVNATVTPLMTKLALSVITGLLALVVIKPLCTNISKYVESVNTTGAFADHALALFTLPLLANIPQVDSAEFNQN